jgi:polyphosphate kinase
MNRNMLRRVELAWPVLDAQLRQRVIDECLVASLHDDRDAWDLLPDGSYRRAKGAEEPRGHSAQSALMERHAAPPGEEEVRTWN